MTILELANKLKAIYDEHGDIEVMFQDPNHDGPYEAGRAQVRVAEEDEFPEDYKMPAGFTFVMIEN